MINNITEKKIKQYYKINIAISLLFFIFSLTQNAFYVGEFNKPEKVASSFAYFFGWFVAFGSGFSWFANPLLFSSWILLFRNIKYALYSSIIAILFSASFLLLDSVATNEGGVLRTIVSYDLGYWLWLSSCVVNCLGISVLYKYYK